MTPTASSASGEVGLSPAAEPARAAASRVPLKLALPTLFVVAAAFHAALSRGHVTPAIFPDELLYEKLAQNFAAGRPFVIRDEHYFFPSPLAALLEAPVWLTASLPTAYAVIKVLNAVVMAAAVFPAYWLARQLRIRPSFALLAAAATVAAPGMLYHSYLQSEALAYPIFLLALATMLRGLARPSPRWELAVVGVSALAVGTRLQFVVLPLAYLVAVGLTPLVAREPLRASLRRHLLSAGTLGALGIVALLFRSPLIGPYYTENTTLPYTLADLLYWAARTAALLPFAVGWLVVPGAVLGFGALLARPRGRAEAAFAALAGSVTLLALLEAGLVGAQASRRPYERYTIYLVPLVFLVFFVHAERARPRRLLYAGLVGALALLAWGLPFPAPPPYVFASASPTQTAYAMLGRWLMYAHHALGGGFPRIATGLTVAGLLAAAALHLRRGAPAALASAAIAVLLVMTAAAYSYDHATTRFVRRAWSVSPPTWLDRGQRARADYLELPNGFSQLARETEAWNRKLDRVLYLETRKPSNDLFPSASAALDGRGTLLVQGRPARAGLLVVDDYGSAIDLEGAVLARPRPGLTLLRTPAAPHVRSLAVGLFFDRWAAGTVTYRAWPARARPTGRFRLELALPPGFAARTVTLAVEGGPRRTLVLGPGQTARLELPVRGSPVPELRIATSRLDPLGRASPRLVGVRIPLLEYVPGGLPG